MRVFKTVVLTLIGVMVPFLSPAALAKTHCSVTNATGAEVAKFNIPVEEKNLHSNAVEKKLADTEIEAYSELSTTAQKMCTYPFSKQLNKLMVKVGYYKETCQQIQTEVLAVADAYKGEKMELVLNAIQLANLSSDKSGVLVSPTDVTKVSVTTEIAHIVTRTPCEFSIRPGVTKSCLIEGQGIPTFKLSCVGIN